VTVTTTRRVKPRLPFAVYVLAALLLVKAGVLYAVAADTPAMELLFADPVARAAIGTPAGTLAAGAGATLVLIVVLAILVRRRIGWLIAMLLTGCFVALDLVAYAQGTSNHAWALLNIVTVFYLNQSDVREALGVSEDDPGDDRAEADAA
jgi:hypothetical protein